MKGCIFLLLSSIVFNLLSNCVWILKEYFEFLVFVSFFLFFSPPLILFSSLISLSLLSLSSLSLSLSLSPPPGAVSAINQAKTLFSKSQRTNLPQAISDPHVVPCLLKYFLRQLPTPLFPDSIAIKMLDIAERSQGNEPQAVHEYVKLVRTVDDPTNLAVICYLFEMLRKVSEKSEVNMMTAHNLGIVFGPALIRPKDIDPKLLLAGLDILVVEQMIKYASALFGRLGTVRVQGDWSEETTSEIFTGYLLWIFSPRFDITLVRDTDSKNIYKCALEMSRFAHRQSEGTQSLTLTLAIEKDAPCSTFIEQLHDSVLKKAKELIENETLLPYSVDAQGDPHPIHDNVIVSSFLSQPGAHLEFLLIKTASAAPPKPFTKRPPRNVRNASGVESVLSTSADFIKNSTTSIEGTQRPSTPPRNASPTRPTRTPSPPASPTLPRGQPPPSSSPKQRPMPSPSPTAPSRPAPNSFSLSPSPSPSLSPSSSSSSSSSSSAAPQTTWSKITPTRKPAPKPTPSTLKNRLRFAVTLKRMIGTKAIVQCALLTENKSEIKSCTISLSVSEDMTCGQFLEVVRGKESIREVVKTDLLSLFMVKSVSEDLLPCKENEKMLATLRRAGMAVELRSFVKS